MQIVECLVWQDSVYRCGNNKELSLDESPCVILDFQAGHLQRSGKINHFEILATKLPWKKKAEGTKSHSKS